LARARPMPRTLTGVLAALLLRPRLAGAETHVTRLIGALTLPPRRLTPQELPVGGYTDMTTHGEVEHILPSQHALDDLEFLRRFAERELLFFRREEPPAQNRQELVVLIDQGVRTWGDVRLVLAAAALALGKQSASRKMRFALAGTSNAGQVLDPLETEDEMLGELIEASDLSFNPGAALEAVLEQPSDALRDVVLLTHPRNLREADVGAAARRAGARDRVFAVTLDEDGAAVLCEVRRGSPVSLRQFHVDFTPAPVPPPVRVITPAEPLPPWTGDVEPVPFPFRFGTSGAVKCFEFDHDGRSLLTVSADGMLHLWDLHGGNYEVLPRPFIGGALLNKFVSGPEMERVARPPFPQGIHGLIGVANGFVLHGMQRNRIILFHYDLALRRCVAHQLDAATDYIVCRYVRTCHAVVLVGASLHSKQPSVAVDLTTTELYSQGAQTTGSRACRAWNSVTQGRFYGRWLVPYTSGPGLSINPRKHPYPICNLDPTTGEVSLHGLETNWKAFSPTANGKPYLIGASISDAHIGGNCLALKCLLADSSVGLMLFGGPDGTLLREELGLKGNAWARLSPDGRWVAAERGPRLHVEKVDIPSEGTITRCGGFSTEGALFLGDRCFLLTLGKGPAHWHLVRWSGALAQFQYLHKKKNLNQDSIQALGFAEVMRNAIPTGRGPNTPPPYDPQRFSAIGFRDGAMFALDRFGQIAVFDKRLNLLCMFMAFRDRLAAWLPDGSRCGAEALGGPETSGTRAKLAQVLKNAGKSKTS
jgi:hypothetical protein